MRLWSRVSARQGALVAMALLLCACDVVVEQGPGPGPRPRPIEEPGFCTREYEPVCARRGRDRQTFSNGCLADAAGYRIIRDGECRRDGGDGGGFGDPRPPRDEPEFCTREYRPVCAMRRGETRTFPNACEARSAEYRIVDDGPC